MLTLAALAAIAFVEVVDALDDLLLVSPKARVLFETAGGRARAGPECRQVVDMLERDAIAACDAGLLAPVDHAALFPGDLDALRADFAPLRLRPAFARIGVMEGTAISMRDHLPNAPRPGLRAGLEDSRWLARTEALRRRRFEGG